MNNNNLDQVTMRSSKRKRSKIPQKFINDTSMGIGEIQPLMVRKCLANSKTRVRVGNVIRLAPMTAPCFGQLRLHHNFSFVGMSDIMSSDVYNGFLTQKPVAFSSGLVQVPQQLPQLPLNILSMFALVGAKWSLIQPRDNHTDSDDTTSMHRFMYQSGESTIEGTMSQVRWVGDSTNSARTFLLHVAGVSPSGLTDAQIDNYLYNANPLWQSRGTDELLYGDGAAFEGYGQDFGEATINVGRIFGLDRELWLPCANAEMPLFYYPYDNTNEILEGQGAFRAGIVNLSPVDYENYDFIIRTRMNYGAGSDKVSAEFFVKLSDFGIRWYKLLMASGVGFDLKSTEPVDLSRFVAMYQAWFNSFGITLYQGWESCAARRLMSAFESNYRWDFGSLVSEVKESYTSQDDADYLVLFKFFRELADMWYTEEQDYVTAHSRQAAVSSDNGIISEFTASGTPNVNGVLNINTGALTPDSVDSIRTDISTANSGGHAYISSILHSQLDSEVLKRLYKVTNRNTIAGRRIAELLKAQGLGQYVKQCRSTFLGHHAVDIEIFDVTATADSTNTTDDASSILGEYVGKGVGEGNSKWVTCECAEVGYFFDLAAVVPESGWTNGNDLTAFDVRPLQQYNPEYDGLGLELSPKSVVCGVSDSFSVCDEDGQPSPQDISFGFIPRYTRYKVARNVLNGSFSLHSVRRSFQQFNLDKIVQLGERVLKYPWQKNGSTYNYDYADESKLLTADKLPIASPVYRYLGRYPWMSNFMRIFSSVGRDAVRSDPHFFSDYDASLGESEASWLFFRSDDPFNVHNVFICDYFAPVLPIEDSFETHDDGNNGVTDMAIGKA